MRAVFLFLFAVVFEPINSLLIKRSITQKIRCSAKSIVDNDYVSSTISACALVAGTTIGAGILGTYSSHI